MSLCIFAATPAEARCFRPLHDTAQSDRGETPEIIITGIGSFAARKAAARWLEKYRAKYTRQQSDPVFCIIGTCAGLSTELATGTVVVYSACLMPGQPRIEIPREHRDRLATALTARGISFKEVVGITTPTMAARRSEKLRLSADGAAVADMETYAILAVAKEGRIPAVTVRSVSDSWNLDVPDFSPAITLRGSIDWLRSARIAVGSPLRTTRLVRAERRARICLRVALDVVAASGCLNPPARD